MECGRASWGFQVEKPFRFCPGRTSYFSILQCMDSCVLSYSVWRNHLLSYNVWGYHSLSYSVWEYHLLTYSAWGYHLFTITGKKPFHLTVYVHNVSSYSVWGHHLQAVDCGQEAADWISAYLGKPGFRLVYLPPDMPGRTCIKSHRPHDKAFLPGDKVSYEMGYCRLQHCKDTDI